MQQQHFEANAKAFYNNQEVTPMRAPAPQSMDAAAKVFFGQEDRVKGQQ